MKSLIIGIARTGSPHNFVLNEDTKYISMCGTKPEVSFSINCGQSDFLKMISGLRYNDADPDASAGAISFFEKLTTQIFMDLKYLRVDEVNAEIIHIRLVTTPFELAQIPFEFIPTPRDIVGDLKIPLLAHPERKITLTREVRQESDTKYTWPYQPRILFAWAQPDPKMTVPHKEHHVVLEGIVRPLSRPDKNSPFPKPELSEFLTELPNASVASIKQVLEEGIAIKKPYTHIHILAHGGQSSVYGVTEFRLLLCRAGSRDTVQKIDGDQLADVLAPDSPAFTPAVVTLAVCDSGHVGNTIMPSGSLAYQLHTRGIPCIFASQFPLTQKGSVILIQTLYDQLINAIDPRLALYHTRVELKKEQNHDWASLVAYARFPEDIEDQVASAKLKLLFGSMKITNAWADHVFKFWANLEEDQKESALKEVKTRLSRSIADLSKYLNPGNMKDSIFQNESLQSEHLGLLGSACKRQAEFQYRLIEFSPGQKKKLLSECVQSLENAKNFYYYGLQANLANHWTTMQYLSLKAISGGSLKEEIAYWYTVKTMAERDDQKATREEDRIWAWGTLGELHMLHPLTAVLNGSGEDLARSLELATDYIRQIAAADAAFTPAKESTARQLDRYIHWWPELYSGKYPPILKERAVTLRKLLPPKEELLGGG